MIQRLKITFFVAFLLLDLVLVGLLVQHLRANSVDASDEPASSLSTSATPEAKVTGAVGLVIDGKSGVIARSMRGSCSGTGQPKLELSVDDGKTFEEIALPLLEEPDPTQPASAIKAVRMILDVTVRSADRMVVVAGDDKCDPRAYETDDGGETWKKKDEVSSWYVDAAGDGVVSTSGTTEPGCDVIALTRFSAASANVMCSGGRIRSSNDGGTTWVPQGIFEEVVQAATFVDQSQAYAVASRDNCARSFSSTDAGITWESGGCVGLYRVTALANDGSTLVATDGGDLRRSTDGGEKWKKP